jgi:hypothetical protein
VRHRSRVFIVSHSQAIRGHPRTVIGAGLPTPGGVVLPLASAASKRKAITPPICSPAHLGFSAIRRMETDKAGLLFVFNRTRAIRRIQPRWADKL